MIGIERDIYWDWRMSERKKEKERERERERLKNERDRLTNERKKERERESEWDNLQTERHTLYKWVEPQSEILREDIEAFDPTIVKTVSPTAREDVVEQGCHLVL